MDKRAPRLRGGHEEDAQLALAPGRSWLPWLDLSDSLVVEPAQGSGFCSHSELFVLLSGGVGLLFEAKSHNEARWVI